MFVVLAMSSQAEGLRMGGVGRRGLGGTSSPRKSAPRASARKRAFYALARNPKGYAQVRSLFLPKRVAKRRATALPRGIAILWCRALSASACLRFLTGALRRSR